MSNIYKKVLWEIVPKNTPAAIRNCRKCKSKEEFYSSNCFRVNANQNRIDVWLIYKCSKCNTTWNETIVERMNVKDIDRDLYEKFTANDVETAWKYCFDVETMKRNDTKFDYSKIEYEVVGEDISINAMGKEGYKVLIKLKHRFDLRLDRMLKDKLKISRTLLYNMVESGCIAFDTPVNVKKHKIKDDIVVYLKGSAV